MRAGATNGVRWRWTRLGAILVTLVGTVIADGGFSTVKIVSP